MRNFSSRLCIRPQNSETLYILIASNLMLFNMLSLQVQEYYISYFMNF